jgi:hypothetical protein
MILNTENQTEESRDMGKSISLVDTESKSATAKMVNKIAFLGVCKR